MLALLIAGWFWNSPFPAPYENNLAMIDFVRLQQEAALYLETHAPEKRVATAWPLSDALQHPEFGYVDRPMRTIKTEGFHLTDLAGVDKNDLLVMYANKRSVEGSPLDIPLLRSFLQSYYDYHPQATAEEIRAGIGFVPVMRWERRGQWIEIYRR
jgi:hypothetical protein